MNETLHKMKACSNLLAQLKVLTGADGYTAVDGVFASHGFADASFKEKTSVLYHIMNIAGGGGSPTLTEENIYALAKDLLVSRDWESPPQGCNCNCNYNEEL
jgi:hypothetical protein